MNKAEIQLLQETNAQLVKERNELRSENERLKGENNLNAAGKEEAILCIIEERDRLKEKLRKACEREQTAYEMIETVSGKLAKSEAEKAEAVNALLKAKEFINNGIEFGYIRMPDPGDTALLVPGIIDKALEKLTGKPWSEVGR